MVDGFPPSGGFRNEGLNGLRISMNSPITEGREGAPGIEGGPGRGSLAISQ